MGDTASPAPNKVPKGKTVKKRKSEDTVVPRLMKIQSNGLVLSKVESSDGDFERVIIVGKDSNAKSQKNTMTANGKGGSKIKLKSVVSLKSAVIPSKNSLKPLCAQHNEHFQNKKAKTSYSPNTGTRICSSVTTKVDPQKTIKDVNLKNTFNFVSVKCENEDPIPNNNKEKNREPVQIQESVASTPAREVGSFQIISVSIIMNNDKAMEFYTGLQNHHKFKCALESLGKDAYDLKYYDNKQKVNLNVPDQFLLTLALLKQHKSHYEMSILFNVTLKDIKNIFITWVRFMRLEWNKIPLPEQYKPTLETTQVNISSGMKKYLKKSESDKDKTSEMDTVNPAKDKIPVKKVYKILNGPQNYIEKHLEDDIIYICHILYFFKFSRLRSKINTTLPGST
ncbi:hypothetical protein QAD02_012158 [Eretmocerus hayati]|uniref:Uncharacterized protein n=1 Tax=Eretmocerus hayati TaxID=131215 RepID=A0ACC2NYY1_9HYME|nr:hypothetical protein QAD02_012158 [Eretmocerus hayati]